MKLVFGRFIERFTDLIKCSVDEHAILQSGKSMLANLVREDNWLADEYAKPHPEFYQQYLLYCDPQERFCVVSFVWGPGQQTPVHNHTVWGLLGQLRGREISTNFDDNLRELGQNILNPGDVEAVSPTIGDIHKVRNGYDGTSVSIHIYGADIGKIERSVFLPDTGKRKVFVSGYSNA